MTHIMYSFNQAQGSMYLKICLIRHMTMSFTIPYNPEIQKPDLVLNANCSFTVCPKLHFTDSVWLVGVVPSALLGSQ